MKQIVKYQNLVISGKLKCEVRVTVDEKGVEYTSTYNGDKSTAISFYPIITLSIIRVGELGENGIRIRAPWNPNDNLIMTKYTLPLFVSELKAIQQDMKIVELYSYQGKRLELNESIGDKIRRVFMIGKFTLELSPTVILQTDSLGEEVRVEGIKMKYNNEQSTVLLTLNDLESLIFNLANMDVDSIGLLMYLNYITKPQHPTVLTDATIDMQVDIQPKD